MRIAIIPDRQPLKTQEGESERDYVNTNESSRSKSRKSYNELKEQDFDQMRRASVGSLIEVVVQRGKP
jgi:hypothetical protein